MIYADFDREARATALVLDHCFAPGFCLLIGPSRVFRAEGHLEELLLSPDGRWILAGWPEADQLLFLNRPSVGKIDAVEDVRREFDPGGSGRGPFPRLAGWCCP